MSVVLDLMRAEWRARRSSYVTLFALFAMTSATYALVLGLVGGLEDHIGGELSDNLAADVRVSDGAHGIADGDFIDGWRDVVVGLTAAAPGSHAAARLEVEGLFAHNGGFTTGRLEEANTSRSAGIFIGIDPREDAAVADVRPYLTRGVLLADPPRYETPAGEPLVPIIVGERFLETSNATVANGSFTWSAVFNVTAGRLENNQLVQSKAIVVGAYSTGFRMIDRAVVYAPRGDVARLIGEHPGDPPTNAILVDTPDAGAVAQAAARLGLTSMTGAEFRQTYLGPVFTIVRVVAWVVVVVLTIMTAGWFAHTLGHHVQADQRKIATLRAIGLPRETFSRLYVSVGGAIGIAGGLSGLVLALLLGQLVRLGTGGAALLGPRAFAPTIAPLEAAALVLLSAGTAAAAAAIALRRVRGRSIRDALRSP